MAGYLDKPQEVVGMFSEALKILDENTVHYMMDEMQKDIDNKNELIEKQNQQIEEQHIQLNELMDALKKSQEEIAHIKGLLEK